jgi:ABC-2 type transport system ATP-binding protein
MAAIRTAGLTKRFKDVIAVDHLDLEVQPGEVFGFIGPNGAGKTTTIRLLLDLIRPTEGDAWLLGLDTRRDSVRIRALTGYLPGDLRLPARATGREILDYFARLRGVSDLAERDRLIERFDADIDRSFRELSRGNRQKIGLVQAFMHRPELVILDEPTSGLDPLMQQEFHDVVRESSERGATLFISSHVLSEVQAITDRAAVLRQGAIVAIESIDQLRLRSMRRMEIRFADAVDIAEFTQLAGLHDVSLQDGTLLRCHVEGDADRLIKTAARHHVVTVTSADIDLEDVFLDYYRTVDHAA